MKILQEPTRHKILQLPTPRIAITPLTPLYIYAQKKVIQSGEAPDFSINERDILKTNSQHLRFIADSKPKK